ncbi:unnamed protein product [Meganyctiphanes norvegica]|uniref:Chitin-binding type-4 domain-containing protein n=1 Tax=Meganyctiphanes norvegica TaxID=48144 RepID=A0AAV2SRT5_MEGNR
MTPKGLVCFLLLISLASLVKGHGRLIEPPSRASAWRYGFQTPIDYQDNEGFCGGFNHQYSENEGRCGICGDAWELDTRPHEAGGLYATGTIVREYSAGEVITVNVDVTANHLGHFEFKLCPNNNIHQKATQECLDQYPLALADGSGYNHWIDSNTGDHPVELILPKGLTCTQCVLQWRYVAGNNWGICEDGTGALGCGPQEEFRACADIAISNNNMGTRDISTNTHPKNIFKHAGRHHNQH